MMDEETRKRAIKVLTAHGYGLPDDENEITGDDLVAVMDDAVEDLVSQEATAINNAGYDAQIEYLNDALPPDKRQHEDFLVAISVPFTTREHPDVGGRIDMTDDMTQRESVYKELRRLIDEGDLVFDLNPVEETMNAIPMREGGEGSPLKEGS